jgi:hypothetical protein
VTSHEMATSEATLPFISNDLGKQPVADTFALREFHVVWPPPC